jgi:hypothetical protein
MPEQPWLANAEWAGRRLSDQAARGRSRSSFVLDTLPGLISGVLRGHIEFETDSQRIRQATTLRATLSCQLWNLGPRPIFGRQRGAALWSKTIDIVPASIRSTANGVSLQVEFAIPSDVGPSNQRHLNGQILWLLDFDVVAPQLKEWSQFEVPVFHAEPVEHVVPTEFTLPMLSAAIEPSSEPIVAPLSPKVRTEETPAGLHLSFAPFRARQGAFTFLGLTAVFGGSAYAVRDSFLLFLLMGAATVLLAYGTLDLFLASSSAVIGKNSVFVERRLIIPIRKTVPRSSITDVRLHLAYGNGSGAARRTFYRIDLITRDRKLPTIIGKYIENRAEGDWLV